MTIKVSSRRNLCYATSILVAVVAAACLIGGALVLRHNAKLGIGMMIGFILVAWLGSRFCLAWAERYFACTPDELDEIHSACAQSEQYAEFVKRTLDSQSRLLHRDYLFVMELRDNEALSTATAKLKQTVNTIAPR